MPLYMDVHSNLNGATAQALLEAHERDLLVQDQYNVRYHTFWFNEEAGKAFCLMDAPSPEAAAAVHSEAHGNLAEEIIEVAPIMVDPFLQLNRDLFPGPQRVGGSGSLDTAFRVIMFTDIEGSTALADRLGDDAALLHVRAHNSIIRECLAAHAGTEVKHTGDGIMASFAAATRALECAIAMQRSLDAHNTAADMPLRVRIGLNAGEPVTESEDLFGSAVNLARRVCDHAAPGQVLVTNVVRELCLGKRFVLAECGNCELKGFQDPVRLYEVHWWQQN